MCKVCILFKEYLISSYYKFGDLLLSCLYFFIFVMFLKSRSVILNVRPFIDLRDLDRSRIRSR